MITIQIDGKTYIARRSKMSMLMPISEWISKWYLEEVKEKPLSQKRAEAIERGKQHSTEYYSALSILEKLREWVDKELKLDGYEHQQILDKIDLLTSLETPQFTPWQEEPETVSDKNMIRINKYDFTPWQEIEVSNDGERWYKKEFTHTGRGIALADKTIYFYTTWLDPEYNDGRKLWEWWKFARPIEDKIEPELPEFSYDRCDEENNLVEQVHEIGVQVEALTTFCQALARQKTTK